MAFFRVVAALVLALVCSPAAAAPLSAYGKLPSIERVDISPNGKLVAVVTTNGEERTVTVTDIVERKLVVAARAGDQKVRDIQFAGDDHLIVVSSVTSLAMDVIAARQEWFLANAIDLRTRKIRTLMRDADHSMNTIHGDLVVRTVAGRPAVFVQGVHFVNSRGVLSLFRIDLESGRSNLLEAGDVDTVDWLVGPGGEFLAQEVYDFKKGRWSLKFKKPMGWRESNIVEARLDRPYMIGLGRDGRSVLVGGRPDGWSEVGAEGGWGPAIDAVDDQRPIFDPRDGRLIGHSALVGDERRDVFFEPADQKMWKAVQAAYPEERVSLVSWSADRRKIVVRCDSPIDGPAYALVDLDAKKGTWIGLEYRDLAEKDIGPRQPVRFKAADGLPLTGYLTLPHGRAPKALPLVVFPHGGPASRDKPGFDWWAQGMASRGYAVLQVNFRGSDGLGKDLLEAGYGQWGRKMQTDLSDGVRHLAAQGIIDPKRVCIVGASYGGYAALAGAAIDRGVYRCAAAVSGPSDLRRMVDWSDDRTGGRTLRYWTRFMGARNLQDPVLAEISPAAHADRVEIPVLLIHGKDDTVVPIEQSRLMYAALQKAGKPVELVVQKGEDHWLSRGDTRLQTLESVVAFLEKHNPPD